MRTWRKALSSFMFLVMFLTLVPLPEARAADSTASAAGDGVRITQTAGWNETVPGRSVVNVRVGVQSDMDLQKPKDVVFVIDRAASQNLSRWKSEAMDLASLLDKVSGMRYALVTYDTGAETKLDFTGNVTELNSAIRGLTMGANCNAYAGFLKAKELIDERPAPAQEACVVLLSTAKFNLNVDKTLALGRQLKAAVPVYGIDGPKYDSEWMNTVCTSVASVEGIAMAVGESRTCPNTAVTVTMGADFTAVGHEGENTLTFPIPDFQMGCSYDFQFSAKLKDRTASGTLTVSERASIAGMGLPEVSAGPVTVSRSTLSVTYAANGGTGTVPVDNGRYNYGDTVAVKPAGSLRKQGWNFSGWRHPSQSLADGTFRITENTNLEAAWGRAFVKLSGSMAASNLQGTQMLSRAEIENKYSDKAFYNSIYWGNLASVTLHDSVTLPMDRKAAWDITDTSKDGNDSKAVMAWVVENAKGKLELHIGGRGGLTAPESCASLFSGCSASSINVSILNTDGVTSMGSMFSGCSSLTSLTGLGNWNTSQVTSMGSMFSGCSSLRSLTGLEKWNTSQVTSMASMFSGCSNLFSIPNLGQWDTSKVTSMASMFYMCTNLYSLDLSSWNVSEVMYMQSMFNMRYDATRSPGTLTLNWGDKTKKVKNMTNMFAWCVNLSTLTGEENWNTSSLEEATGMFEDCKYLRSLDVSGWNTSKLTSFHHMFRGAGIQSIDLSGWKNNVQNVLYTTEMFKNCTNLQSADLSGWAVPELFDMASMFQGDSNLQTVNLSSWTSTSKIQNLGSMFYNCSSLTTATMTNWNPSNATNAGSMFSGCKALTSVALGNWDMTKIKYMDSMFKSCTALTNIGKSEILIASGGSARDAFTGASSRFAGTFKVYANDPSGRKQIYPDNSTRSAAPLTALPAASAPALAGPEALPPVVETPPAVEAPPVEEAPSDIPAAGTEEAGDAEPLPPVGAPEEPKAQDLSASSVQRALPGRAVDAGALDSNGRPVYANKKIGLWDCGQVGPGEVIEYALELQYLNEDLSGGGASGPLTVTNRIPEGLTYNGDAKLNPAVQRIDGADGGETGGKVLQDVQVSENVLTFTVTGLSAGAKYVVTYTCTAPASSSGYTEFLNTASVVDNGMEDRSDPVLHYMDARPADQCTVTYSYENGPAGAAVPESQSRTGGESITLPAPAAVEGYQFEGWKENGAGEAKAAGAPYTVAGDVHFVGVWSEDPAGPKTVRLDYRFAGADGLPENADLILEGLLDGVALELPENANTSAPKLTVLPEGWTFRWRGPEGLNMAEDGGFNTGLQTDWPNGTISITGEWARETYTVTYQYTNAPAGVEPPEESRHSWGEEVDLAPEPPSTETLVFQGWTGADTDEAGRFQMPKENVTITGTWAARTEGRQVRVNPNGGSWQGSEEESVLTLAEYEALEESFPDPERRNFTFLSWEESADPEGLFEKILTAQWEAAAVPPGTDLYTVTFDTQGGAPVPGQRTVAGGSRLTKPTDPTRAGYLFQGWHRDPQGTRPWDFAADTVTRDTTLYAKWTKVFQVSGTVKDPDGKPIENANVEIVHKGDKTFWKDTTGADGKYLITGVPSGIYNTVATYRDSGSGAPVTTTILSVLTDHDLSDQVIQFAAGNTNSVLTVERMPETTPYVVVGGLEREAASVRTESGSPDTAEIRVDMNVTPADQTQNQTEIQAIRTAAERAAAGLPAQGTLQTHVDLVLDVGLTKTLSTGGIPADPEKITCAANILELVIPYPMEGKANILVHRFHSAEGDREGAVTFTRLRDLPTDAASRADKTFYLDADNDLIHVFAQKFSLYAVSYTTETPVTPPVTPPADPPASSGGGDGSRSDDDERSPAAGLLDTEDHRDYLHGFRDGLFRPDASMTRAQAAQMFYNLLQDREINGRSSFTDVPEGMWCYEAVSALKTLGVMRGVTEERFAPDQPITRAELVVTAVRFTEHRRGTASFTDVAETDWYYPEISAAASRGWIGGYPDGTFRPNVPISRAQAAAVINRLLDRRADVDFLESRPAGLQSFPDALPGYWAYEDIMEAANAHDYRRQGDGERWTALRRNGGF